MRYTTKLYTTKSASIIIPEFFPESGEKQEEENVRRMNGFYEELKRSVLGYTGSEAFPEGGRYFAKAQITENGESLEIKMVLRLRNSGKTVSHRAVSHIWKNGVVTEKRIIEA